MTGLLGFFLHIAERNPLGLVHLAREHSMFESAEIGHFIDKPTTGKPPLLREALLEAQFELHPARRAWSC